MPPKRHTTCFYVSIVQSLLRGEAVNVLYAHAVYARAVLPTCLLLPSIDLAFRPALHGEGDDVSIRGLRTSSLACAWRL